MEPRNPTHFHTRSRLRPLLAIAGLALSLNIALAVRMYLTAFPTPSLTVNAVLKQVEALPQKPLANDPNVLVGIEWSTASTFRCRMTNALDLQWTNTLQEWRWFLTWIPRVAAGQTNLDLRSRVLRVREDGMTDSPVEVAWAPTGAARASRWNPSEVPLPTLSAQEAIVRVEAHLRNQPTNRPTNREEVLIVAADWTNPTRFDHSRIRGGFSADRFSFSNRADEEKWVWIITCVHRIPPVYVLKNFRSVAAKNDGVTLYRVEANGHVDGAYGIGL